MTTKTPIKRPLSPLPPAEATPRTRPGLEGSITHNLTPSSMRINNQLEQLPESSFAQFNIEPEINGKETYQLVCPLVLSQPSLTRVFLARAKESRREVVIKRFLEFEQERLEREKTIQKMSHRQGGHKYLLLADEFLDEQRIIISRYMKGGDLRQFQRRVGPLTPDQAKGTVHALLIALQFLHKHHITHRDVKSGNIILDTGDLVPEKITVNDLGLFQKVIPKLFDYETGWYPGIHEVPETIVGTPHYMAPEIVKGEKCDPRIDIYAAGVTLYQLLTGRFPFDAGENVTDPKEKDFQILEQHAHAPIPKATKINPNIGADLQHILETALAKDPEKRYQTAREFRRDYFDALR